MLCSRCGVKNPEDSAHCYECGRKMASAPKSSRQSSKGRIVTEDSNAPTRETKPWPRGEKDDAPTSLDLQPAVDKLNARRGPKLLKTSAQTPAKEN